MMSAMDSTDVMRLAATTRLRTLSRATLLSAAIGFGTGACGFDAPQATGDGGLVIGAPPTLAFAEARSSHDEGEGQLLVTVFLSGPTASQVTVAYTIAGGDMADGFATEGDDFLAADGTLSFAPGELQQGIPLELLADNLEEENEVILLVLGEPSGGARLGQADHDLTIRTDRLPRANFAVTSSSMPEAAGTMMLDVTLDRPAIAPVTLPYTVSGTATNPADFALANGALTFAVGETTKSIPLTIAQDALDEDDESVIVTLGEGTNVVLGADAARTHTILDDDALPVATFSTGAVTLVEANATVTVTVTLDAASGREVTVPVVAGAGTATAPGDFTYPAQLTLTFPAGTTSQSLDIAVKEDLVDEDNETVLLALGTLTNATAGATSSHALTITDDDASPIVAWNLLETDRTTSENQIGPYDYQVVLFGRTERTVTVPVAVGGSATIVNDYTIRAGDRPVTFAPGETVKTVRITLVDDTANEGNTNESIVLTLNTPTNATRGIPTVRRHFINDND